MSDLFRSALGYLSGPSQGGAAGAGTQGGNYTSASGGPADDTNAIGENISFSHNGVSHSIRINKLIAEGGFSYVFRATDLQNGDNVAIKKILAPDDEARKGVLQEIQFMRQFQHDHVVQFFGSFVKKQQGPSGKGLEEYYLAMEFCPVQLPTPPLRLQHTTQVFAQTTRAIKYLHDFGIVHRDIKLENVLIGMDGLVKLVDFGSATMEKIYPLPEWSMNKRTIVEEQIAAKTTPMYRAPEMLDLWSNYPIDERVDLWALGCLLFALNFGQHPFQDSNKLAIVNANYALPKNISPSAPIVSVIGGLLKVDPNERQSLGQVQEVLVSIAEAQAFSLYSALPWKPTPSPNPPTLSSAPPPVGGGIVNPLANVSQPSAPQHHHSSHSQQREGGGGGGGSLFSSLRGGAVSLIKNIKEQSQQYLGAPGTGAPPPTNSPPSVSPTSTHPSHSQPPPRPSQPPLPSIISQSEDNRSRAGGGGGGPPPRPMPPSPRSERRRNSREGHIEFENREYEAMQDSRSGGAPSRPAPPKPPPPQSSPSSSYNPSQSQHHQPKVANLLDMSFDTPPSNDEIAVEALNLEADPFRSGGGGITTNSDLLDDLFGGSGGSGGGNGQSTLENDLLWGNNSTATTTTSNGGAKFAQQGVGTDLLGDPIASLLAKSLPSRPAPPTQQPPQMGGTFTTPFFPSSQPLLQPSNVTSSSSISSSASFGNLQMSGGNGALGGMGAQATSTSGGGPSLLVEGSGKLPKNSSSPNLLVDSILDDIMGLGLSGAPTSSGGPGPGNSAINKSNPSLNNQQRPNYNRTDLFDPAAPGGSEAKSNLNDVFGDILNSQGFSTNKGDQGRTINQMRKIEMLANPNANPTQIKVNEWREGKKKNIRALLASLHTITWATCHWEETNMSQMVTPPQVKKVYRKACLAIHPDKQMGTEWEELAKMIFVELNEAWAAFEESQQ